MSEYMDFCITNDPRVRPTGFDRTVDCGRFHLSVCEPTGERRFWSKEQGNCYLFVFGRMFVPVDDAFFNKLDLAFSNAQYHCAMAADGEYICGRIDKTTEALLVISEQAGVIPLWYRTDTKAITVTTRQSLLFRDFSLGDLNVCAVNDYLRFGCLIGAETLSESVLKLAGGSSLFYNGGTPAVQRHDRFYYHDAENDIDTLMQTVAESYRAAIRKRLAGREQDTCVFLSGGLDSRFLLAEMNKALPRRVATCSFGQPLSEEVNVARACAAVGQNPFTWIRVDPADFVSRAADWEKAVCGADMFPQSYILGAVEKIPARGFVTGYILDAFLGGTFLSEDALTYEGPLSDYVHTHQKQIKMNVFSKAELQDLAVSSEAAALFDRDDAGLVEAAGEYDGLPVCDCVQAFAVDQRAKNLVLLREVIPAAHKDCTWPSCDKQFAQTVAHIPAAWRLHHAFYHDLFRSEAPEYAKIVYNNTQLPALAPVSEWVAGAKAEAEREKRFEQIMSTYNAAHEDKLYYPHYYSDFNGYSRYDPDWQALFRRWLFADDAILTRTLFDRDKLMHFLKEHTAGICNRRRELVYMTSLEIFLRVATGQDR